MIVILATAVLALLFALLVVAALYNKATNKVVLTLVYSMVAVVIVGLASYQPYMAWSKEMMVQNEAFRAQKMIEILGTTDNYLAYLSIKNGL